MAGLSEDERSEIAAFISANPAAGALIKDSGGARKLRFPGHAGGKSGGYRTIHYFAAKDVPIFLMALIDKRRKANLSKDETNQLAEVLANIADEYRKGRTG